MALNGTFTSSQVTAVGDYPSYIYVTWSATQNTESNTSTISWKCYGGSYYNNAYRWTTTGPVVVKINGTTVLNKTGRFNMTKDMLLGSGSLTVSHNTDGTKSVPVSISAAIYYGTTSSTYEGTITLNTIPRASNITSASNVTLGNECSIKWTPASTGFRYKLKFSLGNWSYTTGYISPKTTQAYIYTGYTIPANETIYKQLPNDPDGTMKVILYTYNSSGDTPIGSSDPKTFKVTIPSNIKPTVGDLRLTPAPVNIGGTSYNYLIKSVNKLTVSVSNATAGLGSSIKSYTFSGPSIYTTQTSNSVSINSVNATGTLPYKVTVTDTRERSVVVENTIECYDYNKPSITLKTTRNQKDLICTYKASYASINGINSARVEIYVDGVLSQTIYNVANGSTATVTIALGSATKTYNVYAKVIDALGMSEKSNSNSAYGKAKVMNITSDGTGVAFGKVAEEKGCVDVPKLSSRSNLVIKNSGKGLYINNPGGNAEPAVYRNTSGHLWIGAMGTTSSNITGGGTYISTGDNTNLFACKPLGGSRHNYAILDAENYAKFLPMIPVRLYSNKTGTTGTITLEDDVSNYSYLEIFYCEDNDYPTHQSLKYWCYAGNRFDISSIENSPTLNRVYLRTSRYTASGKTITFHRSKYISISNGDVPIVTEVNDDNYFRITKVIGYHSEK